MLVFTSVIATRSCPGSDICPAEAGNREPQNALFLMPDTTMLDSSTAHHCRCIYIIE